MNKPRTIGGFIALTKPISHISIAELKGFDNLSKEQQQDLYNLQGECENIVSDFVFKLKEKN